MLLISFEIKEVAAGKDLRFALSNDSRAAYAVIMDTEIFP